MKTYMIRHTVNGKEIKTTIIQGYDNALRQLKDWFARDVWSQDNECFKQFRNHSFRVASCDKVYKGTITRLKCFEC